MSAEPTAWVVECPRCGAAPGSGCTTSGGYAMSWEHVSRRVLLQVTTRQTINCRNCGEPITEHGSSPTGYTHRATSHVRCDGKPIDLRRAPLPALARPEGTTS